MLIIKKYEKINVITSKFKPFFIQIVKQNTTYLQISSEF